MNLKIKTTCPFSKSIRAFKKRTRGYKKCFFVFIISIMFNI